MWNIDSIKKENVEIKMTYKDYNYVKKSELKDKVKVNCLGTAKLLGFLKKIVDKNSALILHYGNYVTKKTTNVKYLYQGTNITNCDTDTLKYEELQLIPISLDKLQEKIEDNIKRILTDKYQPANKDLEQSDKKNVKINDNNNKKKDRFQKNFSNHKGGHFGNYNGKYHYNNRFSNYSYNYKNYNHNKGNPSNKNRSNHYKGNVIEVEVGSDIPNDDKYADAKNNDRSNNNNHDGSDNNNNNNNNNSNNINENHGNISHYHYEPGDQEVNLDE